MTARPSRLLFLSASFVMASFVMALTISASSALSAQSFSASPCHGDEGNTHNNSFFGGNQEKVCELRSATLPLVNGSVTVSGKNGGIELIGEDRSDIALEARVIVRTSSREKAEALFKEIKIRTDGSIRAEGPSTGWFGSSWNVNFKLRVPHHLAAELHTENGGIDLTRIDGNIHARTTNGGLSLRGLAGKVDATTTNGGVDVELEGSHWQGEGLEAKSINGGASLSVPDHYNAHLVAKTVNGGVNVDFPVTVQGNIRNHIDTTLGQGGPTIHLETVNGGVDITRK
jgi:DUF4097 and DUF4098 domain-containing protein YvlB